MSISPTLKGKTVFLSASFPSSEGFPWEQEYFNSVNPGLVMQGVKAVLRAVFLRQGSVVFGGHPTITPFVLRVSKGFQESFATNGDGSPFQFVHIYQSRYFKDAYTEEAKELEKQEYVGFHEVPAIDEDLEKSVLQMRKVMFKELAPSFAVFIGGREGIIKEFDLFHEDNPDAKLYPLGVPGGAAGSLLEGRNSNNRISILKKTGVNPKTIQVIQRGKGLPFVVETLINDFTG